MKKLAAWVAVVVVVAGGLTAWLVSRGGPAAAPHVTTAKVVRGDLTVTASASGSVVAVGQRALTFGTSGTVATLSVKAGDQVTTGQVLATLDSTDAQKAVTAAQTALDAANDNLALAKSQAAAAVEAASTPTAKPTATSSPGGRQGGSQAGGSQAGGSQTGGSQGGSQTGGARAQSGDGSDNLLRAQQAVNNDELALEQAQAKLDGVTITAPSAGRVLSVGGAVGDTVSAGGSGFIIMSPATGYAVTAMFSEADVAAVKVGQTATITLADHPDTKYAATVTQIDPAGTTSGSLVRYGVELGFTTVPTGLLLGQSANVAVTTASATDVLYVPAAALGSGMLGPTVTVRTQDGNVPMAVTTGMRGDQGVEIKSGLTAGLTIVIP